MCLPSFVTQRCARVYMHDSFVYFIDCSGVACSYMFLLMSFFFFRHHFIFSRQHLTYSFFTLLFYIVLSLLIECFQRKIERERSESFLLSTTWKSRNKYIQFKTEQNSPCFNFSFLSLNITIFYLFISHFSFSFFWKKEKCIKTNVSLFFSSFAHLPSKLLFYSTFSFFQQSVSFDLIMFQYLSTSSFVYLRVEFTLNLFNCSPNLFRYFISSLRNSIFHLKFFLHFRRKEKHQNKYQ